MTPFGMWLAEIGLGRYELIFASNKIDFDVVRSLNDADLHELGLVLGDRRRLLQAVTRLDEQGAADAITTLGAQENVLGPIHEIAVLRRGERRQLSMPVEIWISRKVRAAETGRCLTRTTDKG